MTVPVKLAGFLALLAAVFGVSYLTGTQSSALLAPVEAHGTEFTALGPTESGYTLRTVAPTVEPGEDQFVQLRLTGPDGRPLPIVDENDPSTDPHAHVIAFRHDFTGFQTVYPGQEVDGTWAALLTVTPGPWRLIVELSPSALGGREISLATDLTVTGDYTPQARPPVAQEAPTAGGLTVRRTGTLTTNVNADTGAMVTDRGAPVTDLQPGHDAAAHAVIVRPSDLGYLHLHAVDAQSRGPRVEFRGGVPAEGTYVMFLEFFRGGVLHVAAFSVEVTQ